MAHNPRGDAVVTDDEENESSKSRFAISEQVLCYYKSSIYEAKILAVRSARKSNDSEMNYLVHYVQWSKSWDEWVSERRLLKFSQENVKMLNIAKQLRKNDIRENDIKLSKPNKKNSVGGSLKRSKTLSSTVSRRSSTSTHQQMITPAPKTLSYAGIMNSSNNSVTLWSWEDVLSHYNTNEISLPRAAPVSAFQYQKVPLSKDWGEISVLGTVGEIDMNARLYDSCLAHLKKKYCGYSHKSHKDMKGKIPYWFAEVVHFEGYIVKVRLLGYPRTQDTNLTQCAEYRWIHFNQLKEIGCYSIPLKNIVAPPLFVESLKGSMVVESLYRQINRKVTVNPKYFEAVERARTGMQDRWKGGSKVEVRNLDDCSGMSYGYVSKTSCHRVEVFYCDTAGYKRKSVWVHEDSEMIQPLGWTKTVGGKIHEFKGWNPSPLQPSELRVTTHPGTGTIIKVGMLFEFINPIKLDEIALGKVTEVLDYGYFNCRIESYMWSEDFVDYAGGENKFHYHISSDELFPLGTFIEETPSPLPSDVDHTVNFDWETYMRVKGLEALELPPKTEECAHDFKDSMWVEAVDSLQPALICPAQIVKIVNPYALKIRFLGWDKKFDQWKPIKSLDIYPVGWCQLYDYPLEPPPVSGTGSTPFEFPVSVEATKTHGQSVTTGASASKMPMQGPSSVSALAVPILKKRLESQSSNCISPTGNSLQKSEKSSSLLGKRARAQSSDSD